MCKMIVSSAQPKKSCTVLPHTEVNLKKKKKKLLKPSREWQSVRLINNAHPCYNINLFQFQKLMGKGSSAVAFESTLVCSMQEKNKDPSF